VPFLREGVTVHSGDMGYTIGPLIAGEVY